MLSTRVISGIVLVAIALIALLLGGDVLYFLMLFVSLNGLYEVYSALKSDTDAAGTPIMAYCGYLSTVFYYVCIRQNADKYGLLAMIVVLLACLCAYVFAYPRITIAEVVVSYFGFAYVPVMLSFFYLTRMLPKGNVYVWLILASSWGCDTCAYFAGQKFGEHHMTPQLSPKKTWEGAAGGLIGAGILGMILSLLTGGKVMFTGLICILGAAASMIGDLAASAIKRNQGIKDFSDLIPGHGGIMDRMDSMIFVAPIIYFFVKLFA
ncbi:MAG: phosphatidate cytidylyltransferase [Blautia sp.]|nr:phosphatidate cytidylyltransferase [Blautia sp.]